MDLKKLKLKKLSADEARTIDGGLVLPWVGGAVLWLVDNWDDVTAGHRQYMNEWRKKH